MPWQLNDLAPPKEGGRQELPLVFSALSESAQAEIMTALRKYQFPYPIMTENLLLISVVRISPEQAEREAKSPNIIQAT